ncbi:hypothetical protein G6O69_27215 [Pseudenhygromyxa sp. WMMC2535]|uniref:hypothetical protein n=1 Tax=Pseudenhygromyxa sp. WMMC2535 TaxID=2712867 RepID=UPI00155234FF|nr:hypothetical protein [Pseudenhygromyxa sp. WMMC2535]NVB41559.1 hypothetical protein [Pseudenhygromyxa sp. WMMC2535]
MSLEARHDWLLAQIEEIADMARKVALLVDGRAADAETAALRAETEAEAAAVEAELEALLESRYEHSHVAMVDPRTAARILRPPQRICAYARLLAARAELLAARGDEPAARRSEGRALALMLEASTLEDDPERVDRAFIAALAGREPPLATGGRQRALLRALGL